MTCLRSLSSSEGLNENTSFLSFGRGTDFALLRGLWPDFSFSTLVLQELRGECASPLFLFLRSGDGEIAFISSSDNPVDTGIRVTVAVVGVWREAESRTSIVVSATTSAHVLLVTVSCCGSCKVFTRHFKCSMDGLLVLEDPCFEVCTTSCFLPPPELSFPTPEEPSFPTPEEGFMSFLVALSVASTIVSLELLLFLPSWSLTSTAGNSALFGEHACGVQE